MWDFKTFFQSIFFLSHNISDHDHLKTFYFFLPCHHFFTAELHLHNERLARHCAGVVEALNKEKDSFRKLQESQNDTSKSFLHKIHDMEKIFLTESRAEKSVHWGDGEAGGEMPYFISRAHGVCCR